MEAKVIIGSTSIPDLALRFSAFHYAQGPEATDTLCEICSNLDIEEFFGTSESDIKISLGFSTAYENSLISYDHLRLWRAYG
jgi:hypothetical protein